MNQHEAQHQTVDRDALVSALERMDRIYWNVLQRQWKEIETCRSKGDTADAFARKSIDAGEESQATMWRDVADRYYESATVYQGTVNRAWQAYHVAYAGLRKLTPVLLGELPIVDLELVKTVDPVELGQRMRKLLGNVLADLPSSGVTQSQPPGEGEEQDSEDADLNRDEIGVATELQKTPQQEPYPDPDNQERNQWLYEQRKTKVTSPSILKDLETLSPKTGWSPITTAQAITDAVKKHAKWLGVDAPKGKSGRPTKS